MANPLFTPTPPSSLSLLFVSTTPHFFPCQLLYSSPPSPLHSELADDFTLVLLVAASRAASHSSLLSYPLQSTLVRVGGVCAFLRSAPSAVEDTRAPGPPLPADVGSREAVRGARQRLAAATGVRTGRIRHFFLMDLWGDWIRGQPINHPTKRAYLSGPDLHV